MQQAQQLAFNAQNPNIETEHLLKALLTMDDSPIEYLLKKNNVTVNLVQNKLDELLNKLPKGSSRTRTVIWAGRKCRNTSVGRCIKNFW